MIDFTNLPIRKKTYAGANGSKISVLYNNELYMLKFPAIPAINKELSYANGCISEYIGCHIFESIGIPVQETILGTYTRNRRSRNAHDLICRIFLIVSSIQVDSVVQETQVHTYFPSILTLRFQVCGNCLMICMKQ